MFPSKEVRLRIPTGNGPQVTSPLRSFIAFPEMRVNRQVVTNRVLPPIIVGLVEREMIPKSRDKRTFYYDYPINYIPSSHGTGSHASLTEHNQTVSRRRRLRSPLNKSFLQLAGYTGKAFQSSNVNSTVICLSRHTMRPRSIPPPSRVCPES